MKKLVIACAMISFGIGAFAQNDTSRIPKPDYEKDKMYQENQGNPENDWNNKYNQNPNQDNKNLKNQDQNKMNKDKTYNQDKNKTTGQKRDTTNKECTVKMENGKVFKVNPDGSTSALNNNLTLQNGVVVMANGTVKMKDGKTVQLKEGECLTQSGRISNKKNKTNNNVDGTK